MCRLSLSLLLLLSVVSSNALAEEPEPRAAAEVLPSPLWSEVKIVKDRVAGSFNNAPQSSRQVSAIRGGKEVPLQQGDRLRSGEAVRTGAGIALLALPDGGEVGIAEGSQLRIAIPLVQRIGTLLYSSPGTLEVQAGETHFRLDGATVQLTSDSLGKGKISVLEGRVLINNSVEMTAGHQGVFGGEQTLQAVQLERGSQEELVLWRAERFLPAVPGAEARHRADIRVGVGMAHLLTANWGMIQLDARLRLGGEAWLQISAGTTLRPGEVDESADIYWSVPIRVGARWIRARPSQPLYFGLGGDAQLLIFPGCPSATSCGIGVTPRPGALVSGIAGIRIHPKLALDLELSGGFHAFALPDEQEDAPLVMPQVGLTASVVFRP
jgi:hypothetical protein